MTKRLFDIVVSAVLLALSSPVLLLVAIAIRLDSRGPVIFRQARSGKGGVPFDIFKFRTMVANADRLGPVITTAGDPRVTRVGGWLRRTKLDELPQLVNVLRGEMSFVGPRPEVPRYVALYTPAQRAVLTVRPGITGISQLELRDEEARLEGVDDIENAYIHRLLPAKLNLDLEYVRNRSLGTDLSILVRTAFRLSDVPRERGDARHHVGRALLRHRRIPVIVVQLVMVAFSNYAAFLLRFDGHPPPISLSLFWQALPWLVVIRGAVFVPFRLYEGLWRYTGIYDLQMLLGGILTSSLVFVAYVWSPIGPPGYSRSIFFIDAGLLTLSLGGLRLIRRMATEVSVISGMSNRVVVYGAGSAGEMIVREARQQPALRLRPVGFIDDDPRKVGMRIHGVRVLGTSDDLPAIVRRLKPSAFLIAVPNAAPERIAAIVETLESCNLPIKILPKLRDMLDVGGVVSAIRPLAVEDFLARRSISLDEAPVDRLIRGRRVLVTGAGGSIGSELCRQIMKCQPAALVLFERHENSLHAIRLELEQAHPRSSSRIVPLIADVTDEAAVTAAVSRHQPHVVFHAAAHKHVPLMEENPCEAVKNNIRGTRILAAAAEHGGVDRMLFISTDKAANPAGVMGASKYVAEQVVLAQSDGSGTLFSIVRFGNVLGSGGSVVPMFLDQIARGGPVTVTHPEARRFFMAIPEAVSLVLHAAAQAHNGGTYVLDMGQQIRIVDLAKHLIRQAGLVPEKDIRIMFTGLRPGEKLAEELVSGREQLQPSGTAHVSQIVRAGWGRDVIGRVHALETLAAAGQTEQVLRELRALAAGDAGASAAEISPSPVDTAAAPRVAPEPGIPCPSCGEGAIARSRARTPGEHIRKRLTDRRLYRCKSCGWRGWHDYMEPSGAPAVEPPAAPDLSALDAGTSQLSDGTAPAKRRRGFSPRDL